MAKTAVVDEQEEAAEREQGVVVVREEPPRKVRVDADEHEEQEDEEGGERGGERTARNVDPHEDDDLTPEQRREKNRRKREAKRQRQESYRREMEYLRKRNDELERRFVGIERSMSTQQRNGLEAQLQQARNELAMAEQVAQQALSKGAHADHMKAMGFRDAARDKIKQLTMVAEQFSRHQQQQMVAEPTHERQNPVVLRHTQRFQDQNDWFDPEGQDEDSIITRAIDAAVANEGYDPATKDYWDELNRRLAKRLPERFKARNDETEEEDDDDQPAPRRARGGPAVGSGRGGSGGKGKNKEILLSPDRVAALKEAGLWDDPKDRMRMAKRYAELDRQARQRATD